MLVVGSDVEQLLRADGEATVIGARGLLELVAQLRVGASSARPVGERGRPVAQPAATARAASSADHTSGSVVRTDAASGSR